MPVRFQVTIDVHDAGREAKFWAMALGYELEPPPKGLATWDDYYRTLGVPEEEMTGETDRIMDPSGAGPRIWFHVVPESKTCKNRLHFDLDASRSHAGGIREVPIEVRKARVEAEAARLVGLGATRLETWYEEGIDHYAVAMQDPEGNEFDIY